MTLVIDPKVALLKGVDPVQFCVFFFILRAMDKSASQAQGISNCLKSGLDCGAI